GQAAPGLGEPVRGGRARGPGGGGARRDRGDRRLPAREAGRGRDPGRDRCHHRRHRRQRPGRHGQADGRAQAEAGRPRRHGPGLGPGEEGPGRLNPLLPKPPARRGPMPHNRPMQTPDIVLRPAHRGDVPRILELIRALADYEQLAHEVEADEETLAATLFGPAPRAEVVMAEADGAIAGFALFFHTYSTFLARPGLYLEDLFVEPRL